MRPHQKGNQATNALPKGHPKTSPMPQLQSQLLFEGRERFRLNHPDLKPLQPPSHVRRDARAQRWP